MDFRLSDEQEMFRKSVRDYVNRELPKSWARELEKDEHNFPHELFGKLAAAGREKWAIGFTEPGGGTDVLGAMRTVATRVDGGWVINGQKTWSSMAHVADYILLLVRTTRDVAKQYQGVSLFILPTASDGVT